MYEGSQIFFNTMLDILLNPLVIFVIISVVTLKLLAPYIKKQRSDGLKNDKKYKLAQSLLTEREASFFRAIIPIASKHGLHVFAKPRIADFVHVALDTKNPNFYTYFNRISQKHIDFLLCNKDFKPVLGVEVDDKTHGRPDRVARDSFVDGLYKMVDLPVLDINKWGNPNEIEELVLSCLEPHSSIAPMGSEDK